MTGGRIAALGEVWLTGRVIIILLLICIPASAREMDTSPVPALVWGPWITGTTANHTIIHVKTDVPANVTVQYATERRFVQSGTYDRQAFGNGTGVLYHIPVEDLMPGTRYQYRVVYGTRTTGDLHFMTCPASGPVTFIVYGDSRDELPLEETNLRHQVVAGQIAREPDVAFVIHTGDIVTDSRDMTDWDRFFAGAEGMLANTTLVPVMGNHEQDTPLWQEIFGTPATYSFDCGDIHVAVLNSNDNVWNQLSYQTAWMSRDLAGSTQLWKFVALHHPLYSSDEKHFGGWANLRKEWEDLFISTSVSAVFAGHVHAYERDTAGTVTYITEGRGGSPFYRLNETKIREYRNSSENSLGYTRIHVDPARGMATADVITVAEIDPDNGNVVSLHAPGTVTESFQLYSPPRLHAPAGHVSGNVTTIVPGLIPDRRDTGFFFVPPLPSTILHQRS